MVPVYETFVVSRGKLDELSAISIEDEEATLASEELESPSFVVGTHDARSAVDKTRVENFVI